MQGSKRKRIQGLTPKDDTDIPRRHQVDGLQCHDPERCEAIGLAKVEKRGSERTNRLRCSMRNLRVWKCDGGSFRSRAHRASLLAVASR